MNANTLKKLRRFKIRVTRNVQVNGKVTRVRRSDENLRDELRKIEAAKVIDVPPKVVNLRALAKVKKVLLTKKVDGKRVYKTNAELRREIDQKNMNNLPALVPVNNVPKKVVPVTTNQVKVALKNAIVSKPGKLTESVKKIGWLLTWTNILFKHNFMCMAFCLFCTFHYKKYYVYSFGEEKASKWFTKWANFASRQSEVAMKRSISEFVAWLSPSLTGGWVVWT